MMNELALFAGAGGGILASRLLGWNTRCAVEIEEYPRDILLQRQQEGHLDRFPIWDDVCTFDGKPWRGHIDVISGGFPCQDISAAGKGAGITGARSGLWKEYARIIGEVRPRFVFAENSPLLRTRGLGVVLQDLNGLGYDVRWGVLGAGHVGAFHKRARMWVAAYRRCSGSQGHPWDGSDIHEQRRDHTESIGSTTSGCLCEGEHPEGWWDIEPDVGRVAHGVADRVDRTKAIGNGQVPVVAKAAWEILTQGISIDA